MTVYSEVGKERLRGRRDNMKGVAAAAGSLGDLWAAPRHNPQVQSTGAV